MRLPRDKDVLENARALRKSMTREERHLWYDFLRGYSARFVRQKVVGLYSGFLLRYGRSGDRVGRQPAL